MIRKNISTKKGSNWGWTATLLSPVSWSSNCFRPWFGWHFVGSIKLGMKTRGPKISSNWGWLPISITSLSPVFWFELFSSLVFLTLCGQHQTGCETEHRGPKWGSAMRNKLGMRWKTWDENWVQTGDVQLWGRNWAWDGKHETKNRLKLGMYSYEEETGHELENMRRKIG